MAHFCSSTLLIRLAEMGKIPWSYVAASYQDFADDLDLDLAEAEAEAAADMAVFGRRPTAEQSLRRLGKKSLGGRVRF